MVWNRVDYNAAKVYDSTVKLSKDVKHWNDENPRYKVYKSL